MAHESTVSAIPHATVGQAKKERRAPVAAFPSNIEIAQQAKMRPIVKLARERLGIPEESLQPYGQYKAKIALDFIDTLKERRDGKLVLVTAISPTPAGEGKTTTN